MTTDHHNWALIHKATGRLHNMLYDTRREASQYVRAVGLARVWRVARVSIREVKRA